MNVVCHQAVAEQPHAVLPAPLRKCLEIESPVFVAQEDVLTIVAPLGDVVWNALHDHTGHPRHWPLERSYYRRVRWLSLILPSSSRAAARRAACTAQKVS